MEMETEEEKYDDNDTKPLQKAIQLEPVAWFVCCPIVKIFTICRGGSEQSVRAKNSEIKSTIEH